MKAVHVDKKDKNSNLIHISGILDKALGQFRKESDTHLTRIWDVWSDAVGEPIARNAKPHAFKDKILIVHVSSSAWIHQLSFLEKDMLSSINSKIAPSQVEQIRFQIGKIHS
ncbi:MAG: DUF721 domain-containing protein [Desulfobacteraceae bacterium]|nr:MAG: DUF721 domain-containing protein [Desulfobacteraceae bacterium]